MSNNHKIDSIGDLKIFMIVADTGSFTKTADISGLSRSAVGKIIAKLEKSLQSRLFHRTTRVVRLSDEGTIFYDYAQRIVAMVDETEQQFIQEQEPQGKLTITVPHIFGRLHIMPIVWEYSARFPSVEVQVLFTDEYQDLVREGIDLAIRIGHSQDSALIQKVLTYHQLITCASPQYLVQNGEPASPQELEKFSKLGDHRCLLYLHEGRPVTWKYQQQGKSFEIFPEGKIALQDTESLLSAALAHRGIVQLSSFLLFNEINVGNLSRILTGFLPQKEPICAVYPSKKYLTPKVRSFIDLLIQAPSLKETW